MALRSTPEQTSSIQVRYREDVAHDRWDPDTYTRFAELRARPFWDLADAIDSSAPIGTMVDLGCGTGELTRALADRLDVRAAVGIDSSPAMLERTREHSGGRCSFAAGDIATWSSDAPVDLVVANASLQWVSDHASVLERWVAQLAPLGQLAVQVPANADHPSHTCAASVAEREPFRSSMGGTPPPDPVASNVLAPEAYAELLHDLGLEHPCVRLKVYPQVMESSAAVVEWTRGTTLTRFFEALPESLHEPFVDAYRDGLLATIGHRSPYFYAFKRILLNGRLSRVRRPTRRVT